MKKKEIKPFRLFGFKWFKIKNKGEPIMDNLENAKIKLAPPWIEYVNKLTALFAKDPSIKIVYDNGENEVKLYVDGQAKADALTQLLPATKEFGNVVLKITVVPANKLKSVIDLYRAAFDGNDAFVESWTAQGVFTNPITYIIFKKEVVQFYNDNLGDAHGNMSTLYQDIAKDIFENKDGIYFCTDVEDANVGKPLGEWP